MKVVCVTLDYTDTYTDLITIGKTYDVIDYYELYNDLIKIVDDIGYINLYNKSYLKKFQ